MAKKVGVLPTYPFHLALTPNNDSHAKGRFEFYTIWPRDYCGRTRDYRIHGTVYF